MTRPGTRSLVALALALAAVACQARQPATPGRPGAAQSARPGRATPRPAEVASRTLAVPQKGTVSQLLGKAKLLFDPATPLLGDQGSALISDQGGALISDQGGAVLSNNGGTLVSNNGGGLLGKAKRVVLQAPTLGVYALADAELRLFDAAGRLLVDDAGKPLTTTTGPDGAYRLEAVLPPGNLVARIKLWNGGELSAIVAREGAQKAEVQLTTASTLGASYVLGLARGDQPTLDKLPRAESDRLVRELDAVRGWTRGAFKHDDATLAAVTSRLRARIPAVERVAKDVEALLLGQARLGTGKRATEVPLAAPAALAPSRHGLLIGELNAGRLRAVGADGTLKTLLDKRFGTVRANLPSLWDAVEAPDGTLYVVSQRACRVYRIPPGGSLEPWLGSGDGGRDPAGEPTRMRCLPAAVALAPDGTLWVGETRGLGDLKSTPPRLLAVRPDRTVEVFEHPSWGPGDVQAVAVGKDGAVIALHVAFGKRGASLVRLAQGTFETLKTGLQAGTWADLALTPDGTLLVTDDVAGELNSLSPEGRWERAPETEALKALGFTVPGEVAVGPDGTRYLADMGLNLVAAWQPGGLPTIVAGTRALFQTAEGGGFAINMPGGLTADERGRLLVSELGSHTVRAFDGQSLATVAGTSKGFAGDGAPAGAARLDAPKGIAWHAGELWIVDDGNSVLRRIRADGTIETVAGFAGNKEALAPGTAVPGNGLTVEGGIGVAVSPRGAVAWANGKLRQVHRFEAGTIRHVAGAAQSREGGALASALGALLLGEVFYDTARLNLVAPFGVAFSPAGDLYVSDAGTMQIYRIRGFDTPSPTLEWFAGVHVRDMLARLTESRAPLPDEEGKPAQQALLAIPTGLAFDAAGNLYVCEGGSVNLDSLAPLLGGAFPLALDALPALPTRVRRIAPDGTITTVAGPGGKRFKDPDAEDVLVTPTGLTFVAGSLAIADSGTNLVHLLPRGSY